MPTIDIPDTTIHFEDAGSGAPLLLLHGGLGTALLHYRREIPFFAGRHRVIAPDMRGYGGSAPPRDYPIDFYQRDAADMAALLDALDARPVHVLGWSDGAIVALVLAVVRPDLVRSLALWGGEAKLLEVERSIWPVLADASVWPQRAVERFIEAQGPLNWPGILDRMVAGYTAVLDGGGEIISQRLDEIRCPVLIMHGEQDDVVPVVHAQILKDAIPQAEVHLFPESGHALHREQESAMRGLILDFLRRVESGETTRVSDG
ncbi:MAG: alpha/beta fold hydrolase [Dehalococcoidia bacterium]